MIPMVYSNLRRSSRSKSLSPLPVSFSSPRAVEALTAMATRLQVVALLKQVLSPIYRGISAVIQQNLNGNLV